MSNFKNADSKKGLAAKFFSNKKKDDLKENKTNKTFSTPLN